MLDHDDGVVDDEPDRRGHAAQGHDVEPHAERVEQHDRRREGGRDATRIAIRVTRQLRKKSKDESGEASADEDRVAPRSRPRR